MSSEDEIRRENQKRFDKFIDELEEISKKHGVLLNVTGGVHIVSSEEKIDEVHYSRDSTSGDLSSEVIFSSPDK